MLSQRERLPFHGGKMCHCMSMAHVLYPPICHRHGWCQGLAAVNDAAVGMGENQAFMEVTCLVLLQIKPSRLEPRGGAQNVLSLIPGAALSQRLDPAPPGPPALSSRGAVSAFCPLLPDLWTKQSGQELKQDSRVGTRLPTTVLGLSVFLNLVKARPEAQGAECAPLLATSCD